MADHAAAGEEMIALYDLMCGNDRIYVGITGRTPAKRLAEHRARGVIPRSATIAVVTWFSTSGEARQAERARIEKYRPKYNAGNRICQRQAETAEDKYRREYAAWECQAITAKALADAANAWVLSGQCRKWKKEGLTVREIVERVKAEYKITISHGAVQNYLHERK